MQTDYAGDVKQSVAIAALSLLFAGCTASVLQESPLEGPGFTGVQVMNACVTLTGDCFPLEAESDGTRILRLHYPTDIWVETPDSTCSNGYCWVVDANGAEWKLEP